MKNVLTLAVVVCIGALTACQTDADDVKNKNNNEPDPVYTVMYDANGASGTAAAPDVQTGNEGSLITLPGASGLSKSGFTFGGWNTLADGTGTIYSAGSSYTLDGNVTLYVYWLDNSWPLSTVTYNANGAGSGLPPAPQAAYTDTVITLPNQGSLTHPEKMFRGWNTRADGEGTLYREGSSFTVSGNLTVYAHWDTHIVPGENLTAKLSWLQTNAESGKEYLVEVDTSESIDPTTLSYSDRENITITLQGVGSTRTIGLLSNNTMFEVGAGVTLILDNNISLQGRSNNSYTLVSVYSGGTLIMNEGSRITLGSGVYLNDGAFTMNGGEISRSNSSGVSVGSGTFTMNGGEISRNNSSGVSVGSGTFTMNGGEISRNNSSGVYSSGIFTMNGGVISYNTSSASASNSSSYSSYSASSSSGGGVYNSGTLTMNGGVISDNTSSASASSTSSSTSSSASSSSGGGVYNSGIFTMNGGVISDNTSSASASSASSSASSSSGGGVYVNGGVFTMSGGAISDNVSATNGGGGVYVSDSTFTMTNGKISGNTASASGGGVYVNSNGTFTIDEGEVSGNIAYSYGGGVYVDAGVFAKSGGSISGNVVRDDSGARQNNKGHSVYAVSGNTFRLREDTVGQSINLSLDGTVSPAVWSGAWYCAINFALNGGSGTTAVAQSIEPGSSITLPSGSGLSRDGFSFYGWNTRADGTGDRYNGGDSYTVTNNITLYAQWIPSSITIVTEN